MEKLEEQLTVWQAKEKILNKPHGGKNSYFKMENNDTLSPTTPFLPTNWVITPIINKKSKQILKLIFWKSLEEMSK